MYHIKLEFYADTKNNKPYDNYTCTYESAKNESELLYKLDKLINHWFKILTPYDSQKLEDKLLNNNNFLPYCHTRIMSKKYALILQEISYLNCFNSNKTNTNFIIKITEDLDIEGKQSLDISENFFMDGYRRY